jgi:hypothetical protein
MDDAERVRRGMAVRREVLGDEHVDRALEPSGYLGAAGAFVTAALDAHQALEARHG